MKVLKSLAICLVSVSLYLVLSFIVLTLVQNSVLATVISDIIFAIAGYIYYKHRYICRNLHRTDAVAGYSNSVCFLFLLYMAVLWIFVQITTVTIYNILQDTAYDSYRQLSESESVLYLILTIFIAPIAEEILLRGIVFNSLKASMPIGLCYAVSSFIFAILHGTVTHIFLTLVMGFFFAIIYEYTHMLRYSILFHGIFNLMTVVGGALPLPDILFEPVVFISADIILVTGLVIIAYKLWNRNKRIKLRELVSIYKL